MRFWGYFLAYDFKNKSRLHQLDFIGAFLQANFKNRVFVKLDRSYAEYLSEYSSYFGRDFRLLKYMHGMTNFGKLFADELTYWLINESEFKQSQFQITIYYKYATDGTKCFVLSYVDDCVYWYKENI